MDDDKLLLAKGNLLQAHTWKGLLETYGIEIELRGEALMSGVGELPVDVQAVELWVTSSQAELAQTHLAKLSANQPQWQCLQCQEINEGNFEICWQCGAEAVKNDESV